MAEEQEGKKRKEEMVAGYLRCIKIFASSPFLFIIPDFIYRLSPFLSTFSSIFFLSVIGAFF